MSLYISKGSKGQAKNIVLDDMILTTDYPTSAGSKMLDGYKSVFEATVVSKLKEYGYHITGKANVGEFALDFLGETSFYGACTDADGTIKSAAAQLIQGGEADAAVVFDVNGYPVRAAALSDAIYVKPTYGVVSRFGTIPAACSGDTVGVMATDAETCQDVLAVIAGHDEKDGTSLSDERCDTIKAAGDAAAVKKVAVIKELADTADEDAKGRLSAFQAALAAKGVEAEEVSAKDLLLAQSAWNILMSAEVCNNVSKYDGVKYGYRSPNYTNIDELYTNSRTEAFGYLLKSVILYGSHVLSTGEYQNMYDKALKVRRIVSEAFARLFAEYDGILIPACSKASYPAEEIKASKTMVFDESRYTAPADITGLPVVAADGVQLVGKAFTENHLLALIADLRKEGGR